jgi:hypothetical protein
VLDLQIKERSLFARIARLVLKTPNVAMVLGKTIHLSGVSREAFLQNKPWVAHELCHVRQFQEHGYFRFLGLYLLESMKRGYYHNKYEVEARLAGTKEARSNNDQLANNQ